MTNKAFCRIFQCGVKFGNYFLGYRTPELIEGAGCIEKVGQAAAKAGLRNVLVVIGPNIYKRGLANTMLESLTAAGVSYKAFSDLQANPTDKNVEAGLKVFKEADCDSIIAFGGGSPMDCAKAIAARAANPKKNVAQLQGLLKAHHKICPLWAVPTTAGTGSETTMAAVITESATHHKASINDTVLIPKLAVLDPELTRGLPAKITATTGMDALCHAVEAYTNWTYLSGYEKDLARNAVKLIYENIMDAVNDGNNIKARQNMQRGAFFAGRAFTRGSVGYVHAAGHPLSAMYDLPHGLVMAVLLPWVMRLFGQTAHKRLSELADVCGICKGGSEAQRAEAFISWIETTNKTCVIPDRFDCIKDEDIDQMSEWAEKEGNPLYPVPVIWSKNDFQRLYKQIR